jgi:hypothetical protein
LLEMAITPKNSKPLKPLSVQMSVQDFILKKSRQQKMNTATAMKGITQMTKSTIDMAHEVKATAYTSRHYPDRTTYTFGPEQLKAFEALVRADEREVFTKKTEEFARKWWKIHCDSNLHYSSTLKAHQDFCALQAAIRARGSI